MVKGAFTSVLALTLMWPDLAPNPVVFAPIEFASAALLVAWWLRRFYGRGPLADLETRIGPAEQPRSWFRRIATRTGLSVTTILAVLVLGISPLISSG